MPGTILILEKTPLISLDLFEIVSDAAPLATIHVVRSAADALRMLEATGAADLAFIGTTRTEPGAVEALSRLTRRIGRIVLTVDPNRSAVPPGPGWHMVQRPFAPRSIQGHIAAMSAARLVAQKIFQGPEPGGGPACSPIERM